MARKQRRPLEVTGNYNLLDQEIDPLTRFELTCECKAVDKSSKTGQNWIVDPNVLKRIDKSA